MLTEKERRIGKVFVIGLYLGVAIMFLGMWFFWNAQGYFTPPATRLLSIGVSFIALSVIVLMNLIQTETSNWFERVWALSKNGIVALVLGTALGYFFRSF